MGCPCTVKLKKIFRPIKRKDGGNNNFFPRQTWTPTNCLNMSAIDPYVSRFWQNTRLTSFRGVLSSHSLAAGRAAEEGQIKFSHKLLSGYLRNFKQLYLKNNNNKKKPSFFPPSLEHNLGCNSEVKSNSISSHLGINSHANALVVLV